jgi:hypothetical protein
MFDPSSWEPIFRGKWATISGAPYAFAEAVFVGWLVGWIVIRAWYRRQITNGEARTKLIETERDIERKQKEGLRQAMLEAVPGAPVLALEISHGDPELRAAVVALGKGGTITTPKTVSIAASPEDLKRIAQLNYLSRNELSRRVASSDYLTTTSTGTATTAVIVKILDPERQEERYRPLTEPSDE